jgi:glycerophosphoryl diester phosphodiesterase
MVSIIAHRGASGYLPEHTLPSKALAYAMQADFLEQDVVATRDDQLVVLHDVHLDRVTDVAERHPARARADGRYYVRDFDLDELRQLRVTERVDASGRAVYPKRFPAGTGRFHVHTLAEELELVAGLNRATGRDVGVYPEIKRPAWHHAEGVDVSARVLQTLADLGYADAADPVFVQCFDAGEVMRLRHDLDCRMRLVQLIGDNTWGESDTDYDELRTGKGLESLAGTVHAIGPWLRHLYTLDPGNGKPVSTGLAEAAHDAGLLVHPYTFRADDLPEGFQCFEDLVRFFVEDLGIDGLFTEFPDRVHRFRT